MIAGRPALHQDVVFAIAVEIANDGPVVVAKPGDAKISGRPGLMTSRWSPDAVTALTR